MTSPISKSKNRVVFGDNQFFGINHMSEERARAQAIKFQDTQAIIDVLDIAYEEGIRVFMCTTHERIAEVCDYFRREAAKYPDFVFYPCMPYAHKYANAVTEHGAIGALKSLLPEGRGIETIIRGGLSVANKDIEGILKLLVDAEMKMFRGLNTPVIFLQNVVTDLLLGLGFKDAFKYFSNHIVRTYGAEPGFITMNLPLLLETLDEVGIENPIVCSNINKVGFRMCGGTDEYLLALVKHRFRPMAMSILASGAIPPSEAIDWVCSLPQLDSIVFGASSRANIRQTAQLIEQHWGIENNRETRNTSNK